MVPFLAPGFDTDGDEQAAALLESIDILAERVRHVMQSTFDRRRIVLFSGGPREEDATVLLEQGRAIRDGGGTGSIMRRNVFQRDRRAAQVPR